MGAGETLGREIAAHFSLAAAAADVPREEEQSAAAKEGVLAPAHSLGGVVRRHFFVAPRSQWAHFTAT